MAGSDEHDIDGVAVGALQPMTLELAVGLHVPDDRLDGAAPLELAFDGRRDDAPGVGQVDLRTVETMDDVPAGSVVVPGTLPSGDRSCALYCAVIVKKVDAKTRAKTSLNELLRGD